MFRFDFPLRALVRRVCADPSPLYCCVSSHLQHSQFIPQNARKLLGPGSKPKEEESEALGLPDLVAALERAHHYAKSELLYRLRNKPLPS